MEGISKLIKQLRRAGYACEQRTRSGHWLVHAPGGPVYLPGTPGRGRSYQNSLAELRRKGVKL